MSTRANETRVSKTIFYFYFNIICSILLVLLNKYIYRYVNFPNVTLTFLHFVTTFIGLNICERFNLFQIKLVPLEEVCLLSVTFCGFVIFTNLSLEFNTLGTYQLAKVLTTPVVIFLQMFLYKKKISLKIKCTLVPIIVGILMTFYYDVWFDNWGTVCAIAGVFITSYYQILVCAKQHELQMDPLQLLYYQAPISSLMLLFFVIIFKDLPMVNHTLDWTPTELGIVFSSCIVAFCLNISLYWIIGKTSPLTYNMVGHLKFCLVTIGGWMLFEEPMTLMQLIGTSITLSGVTVYTYLKLDENALDKNSLEEGSLEKE